MSEDTNAKRARFMLADLDACAEEIPGPAICKEVAKALTLAKLHGDIEARVVCDNFIDASVACGLLYRASFMSAGGKWDATDQLLELPNGSAVRVMLTAP